jgi:hypothetical protein
MSNEIIINATLQLNNMEGLPLLKKSFYNQYINQVNIGKDGPNIQDITDTGDWITFDNQLINTKGYIYVENVTDTNDMIDLTIEDYIQIGYYDGSEYQYMPCVHSGESGLWRCNPENGELFAKSNRGVQKLKIVLFEL